jgi:hypothetical protein
MVGPCSDAVDVETDQSPLIRFEIEVEPRPVLKFQTSFSPVTFPANDHERGHEADYFKVLTQFLGVPNLPVLGFESFTATRLSIDFGETLTA